MEVMKYSLKKERSVRKRFWIIKGILKKTGIEFLIKSKQFFNKGDYPNYIIGGASRSGTTSLFYYLGQHSRIKNPSKKEIYYFERNYNKRKKWYRAHFPEKKSKKKMITGEATPEYLFFHKCPKRIHELLPKIKIIFILRNPVNRIYSLYNMYKNSKHENVPFDKAIEREMKREKENTDYRNYPRSIFRRCYLIRGRYLEHIKRYLRHFNKNQILILSFEKLRENPQQEVNKVFDFLGLEREKINSKIKNKGKYKTKMNPRTRKELEKYFKPYNDALYEYLGTDFGWQ